MTRNYPDVTIVVPVYGDWSSLSQCIESLKKYVSPKNTKILLVNDCGPEVEQLERNIKKAIKNHSSFEYYRNDTNLGFVKTCNRAVFELDTTHNDVLLLNSDTIVTEGFLGELQEVLYLSEKHGSVCARSNNATIATVPFMNKDNTDDRDLAYSKKVYDVIKSRLPRFAVVPVTIGFCMLIKRNLIDDYGLFDEAYQLGYGEECDFCQRINKYGYSSVLANYSYVYHLESRSFTSEKKARLMEANEKVLHARYPYYPELVQRYIRDFMDPVDWFADIIAGQYKQKKILINLMHLPSVYNGTARNVLTFLKYIQDNKVTLKEYDFTIVTQEASIHFFKLDSFGIRIKLQRDVNELYDVGYCPSQIFTLDHLLFMNRYCYRMVFSLLDIIAIRSNKLLANDYVQRTVFIDAINAADKIITISDSSRQDAIDYFGIEIQRDLHKFEVIYQGFNDKPLFNQTYTRTISTKVRAVLEGGSYCLVQGNAYDFKRLKETIEVLRNDSSRHYIVMGYEGEKIRGAHNITTIPAGSISDEELKQLRDNAKVIILPSIYEGFGLFITESLEAGKPTVVSDMNVNIELKKLYKNTDMLISFERLSDIPDAIEKASAISSHKPIGHVRDIDDYNRDTMECIRNVINTPLDDEVLRARWKYFSRLTTYLLSKRAPMIARKSAVHAIADTLKTRAPGLYHLSKRYYRKYIKKS